MSRYRQLIMASNPYAFYSFDYSNQKSTQIVDEIGNRHPLTYVGQKEAVGLVQNSLQYNTHLGNSLIKNPYVDVLDLASTKKTGHLETVFSNDFNLDNGLTIEFLLGLSIKESRTRSYSQERARKFNLITLGSFNISVYLDYFGDFSIYVDRGRYRDLTTSNITNSINQPDEENYIWAVSYTLENVKSQLEFKLYINSVLIFTDTMEDIENVKNIGIFKNEYTDYGDLSVFNHYLKPMIKNISFTKGVSSHSSIILRHSSIFNRNVIGTKFSPYIRLVDAQSVTQQQNNLKDLRNNEVSIFSRYHENASSIPIYIANANDGEVVETFKFNGNSTLNAGGINRLMVKPSDTSLQCIYSVDNEIGNISFSSGLWTGIHSNNYTYIDKGLKLDTGVKVSLDRYDKIHWDREFYINDNKIKFPNLVSFSSNYLLVGSDPTLLHGFYGYIAQLDFCRPYESVLLNNCEVSYLISVRTKHQGLDESVKVFLYDGITGELVEKKISSDEGKCNFIVNEYKPYMVTSQLDKESNTPILTHGLIYPSSYV